MKMRRLLSCIMALLLIISLPVSALADEYDLAQGSVTVSASESGQTVTHKEETRPDSAPVITQSGGGTTANTVTIEAGAGSTANVTLDGVNISADVAAIQTSGSGDVVIELDGENTVQSGEGHAGVEKDNSKYLLVRQNIHYRTVLNTIVVYGICRRKHINSTKSDNCIRYIDHDGN